MLAFIAMEEAGSLLKVMTGFVLSYMAYLAIFAPDIEKFSPNCECVDVGAKFEGETKERRCRCRRLRACPFQ